MLAAFTLLIINMQGELKKDLGIISNEFENKSKTIECAALINYYYAHSTENLEKSLDCEISGNKALLGKQSSVLIPENVEIVQSQEGKKIIIGVDSHYR